jgi:hypothetical protein
MRNASAAVWEPTSAHTLQWQNPDGDFATTYVNTHAGRTTGRLTIDQIPSLTEGRLADMSDRTFVLLSGTIECVRIFENTKVRSLDLHRATIRLSSGTGADVIVYVAPYHYDRIWGYLVTGRRLGIAGTVRRETPDAPPVIDLVRLLMARTDAPTAEDYQLLSTIQAVTV